MKKLYIYLITKMIAIMLSMISEQTQKEMLLQISPYQNSDIIDLDVHQIAKALLANEDNQTKTPLLRDVDTGDNYVIQNIYEDEDKDIIIEIKYL